MNLNLNSQPASEAEHFADRRTARAPEAPAKVRSRHPLLRACIAFLIAALASMAASAVVHNMLPSMLAGG
jgi:hypothetical protein